MPPKRRRRFQGLYYHSSPPKVLPMNGQLPNDSGRRRRGSDDFSIKLSTIRIWMHEKEIGKLTRILWAGQGNRLRQQASTNPRVKRFLAAVPYVMNSIRDVHQAVIDNNLENLQAHLEPPVPPALVTCRDANGLNLIHKAAGLGHATILEYLITTWPDGVHECDITGKTPLHWAASAKNNMRCYTLLTQAGCDEEAVDYKMKTPSFYRHKPHEIERAFLTYVPEAPRVSPDVATDWEALSDDSGDGKNPNIKIPEMNGFGRHSNTESNENTSEAEMTEGASAADDDDAGGGDDEALTEEPEKEEEPAAEENGDGDAEPAADEEEEQAEEEKPAEDETEDKKEEENAEETENANEEAQTNDDEATAEDKEEPQDEESRINRIIASGDMEQLAQIVLNGDGQKLLNVKAKEPEIQAFLRNVPNYMDKIRRVHEAARGGSLLNLQQALDRRKFAIAKDEISPNGATPLHVAVLFGHSDIVRYLSARFPETTSVTDNDGRTALHYAAVISDNGHFYNVLQQLGANPKAMDNFDKTPEQYLADNDMKDTFNYGLLLKNFGAEELEEQLLSDQVPDDLHSSRRLLNDGDIQRTLDRCFSVIQESSKVWSGATASALAQKKPLSDNNSLQLAVTGYLSRFLKPSVYEKIKKRQTRLDHNLFDVLWPALRKTSKERHLEEDINCGVIAPDFDVYVVFQEFMVPLIKDMHCMSVTADFKPHPRIAYFPMQNAERLNTAYFVFEDDSNLVVRCQVECSRNLDTFELPLNLTIGQIEQAERLMMAKIFSSAFIEAIDEEEPGSYYTLTEILEENSEVHEMLSSYNLLIPLLDQKDAVQQAESIAFNGPLWPYGRGVYVSASNNMALWLNCQEHLRIISSTSSKDAADIGSVYTRIGRCISFLEQQLHFKESYLLGYLQSRPSFLGTGLKMTTIIRLPNLMKEMDNLRHLCSVRGLALTTNRQSKLSVRLINMQSMGSVEHILFQDYCTAVTNILSLEKDMSLTNSKHIASMLVKIFRRKIENQSFEENPIFKTEQGKYLAENLADPLIKALTQVAQKRPQDPLQYLTNYLQTFVAQRNTNGRTVVRAAVHSGSSHTDSTALAANSQTDSLEEKPIVPTSRMNGHVTRDKGEDIETDPAQQQIYDEDADEAEAALSKRLEERDEHGQSMLHFASARSHRRGGLLQLIEESKVDITYRDELYRTARDVALQANQVVNAKDIDRYLISLAIVGDVKPFEYFAIAGYDHIIDLMEDDKSIIEVAESKGHTELATYLRTIRPMEELREELHQMIRDHKADRVKEIVAGPEAKWLLMARNYYGRTALHIAILKEDEELVEHFVKICPEALKIGDNLERSPLHYAMGTNLVEGISRILIQNGAKRTNKDLKGRQPSYYFMNKADILRLQEEEDENR
ncbi:uncharacterized protein LOC101893623 isoform X7 [Musca domestica]|uniref:Uncharacterized protein LOC101893623 isoform X7 n=1 Tax=Musca domestica TaxID=7370 RepID=A0ABM3UQZ5_MUSDO|nr:uncharacterized protein LOC101893623 isoform X7 [Musca domestica]